MRDPLSIHHARPIGVMLTGLEDSYAMPARWCEKCGARLRRGNDGTLCAPCHTKHTPTPAELAAHASGYRCDWCERPFIPNRANQAYCSPTCRSCSIRSRDRARKLRSYVRQTDSEPHSQANGGRPRLDTPHHEATLEA